MIYIHKRNNFYIKLCEGRSSEECAQEFVVYMALYSKDFPKYQIWIRPKQMWQSDRFRKLTVKELFLYLIGQKGRIKF